MLKLLLSEGAWCRYKREEDEARHPLVVAVGEQGEPHVGEHKVLCQEVKQLKEVLYSYTRLIGEVQFSVVGLHYTTKQYGNNTW